MEIEQDSFRASTKKETLSSIISIFRFSICACTMILSIQEKLEIFNWDSRGVCNHWNPETLSTS